MICPHCGKELNTTTFINPMQHIAGCAVQQPIYLNLGANGVAGGGTIFVWPNPYINVCAGAVAQVPQVTYIKL